MSETVTEAPASTGERIEAPASGAPTGAVPASGTEQGAAPVAPVAPDASAAPVAPAPGAPDATPPAADPVAKPAWPDNWRDQAASGDEKLRATLERYDTPAAMALALRNAQIKISQGIKPEAPGPDATPEEKAAYRAQLGVPATPADYKVELPNGLVIGDADKPLVDAFLTEMHGKDWSQKQVAEALAWHYQTQERVIQEQENRDDEFKATAQSQLQEAWGGEFKKNLNVLSNFLAGAPAGVSDRLLGGRTADGRLIGDDPAMLQYLVGIARDVNPTATLLPAGMDNMVGVEGEIANIRTAMQDPRSDYWNGPKSEGMQKRYRELLTAHEKLRSR